MLQEKKISKTQASQPVQKNKKTKISKAQEDNSVPQIPASPSWSTNTKLVVALTVIVIAGALFVKFQFILTPLMIAFVFSYLFYPIASFFHRKFNFSWGASVGIIYTVVLILLLALLALGGVSLIQQVQSVVTFVNEGIKNLPSIIEEISGNVYEFGPFKVDLSSVDLQALSNQLLSVIQPILSRTGSIVGTVAGSAANFFGWLLFIILVSYFVLAESGGLRARMVTIDIPGYASDIERLTRELGRIWNAFLRGQIIIFFLTIIAYAVILYILGVQYAFSLALMAGVARFLPYIGPAINWIILCIVAYFQEFTLFDMSDINYTLLILIVAIIIDQVFDNMVTPRILSNALKVHPAAVLVAAIIAANLLGLLGVVIAAPMLATVALFWQYTMRKLLDLDPWPEQEPTQPPPPTGGRFIVSIRRLFRSLSLNRPKNT